jgi:sigma-B regulation protein RsbU (phosphoserine phosphatase)
MCCESGLPLGVDANEAYAEACAELQPGDGVVLYTDGITESMNAEGELLGTARLDAAVAREGDAEGTVREVLESVWAFTGGSALTDDRTLLALRIMP